MENTKGKVMKIVKHPVTLVTAGVGVGVGATILAKKFFGKDGSQCCESIDGLTSASFTSSHYVESPLDI